LPQKSLHTPVPCAPPGNCGGEGVMGRPPPPRGSFSRRSANRAPKPLRNQHPVQSQNPKNRGEWQGRRQLGSPRCPGPSHGRAKGQIKFGFLHAANFSGDTVGLRGKRSWPRPEHSSPPTMPASKPGCAQTPGARFLVRKTAMGKGRPPIHIGNRQNTSMWRPYHSTPFGRE